jgi:hypothetical protein
MSHLGQPPEHIIPPNANHPIDIAPKAGVAAEMSHFHRFLIPEPPHADGPHPTHHDRHLPSRMAHSSRAVLCVCADPSQSAISPFENLRLVAVPLTHKHLRTAR